MENQELNDWPPAMIQKEYPIIRCENCFNILSISFNMNKKEIFLKCEKENKTKNITFEKFFETIDKYGEINCCQFCKNKKPSDNYYMCKTCQNKILCSNCFKKHNKEDDMIKFKIDSSCKKHCNPYEYYCPICKENKCSYCSIEHDEEHGKKEILLKDKLLKKNKLIELKKKIKKIYTIKDKIENTIVSIIKELEEKILLIKKLKDNFFESLNMQLKLTDLVLQNYEKKILDFDVNYFLINNLENQININLFELNLDVNDSLEKKIEKATFYMKENLKNNFKTNDNKLNDIEINNETDKIIDVDYEYKKEFNFEVSSILDFNKYLLTLINNQSIVFVLKNNYEIKFKINEKCINNIKICRKINEEKLLVSTSNNIIIIKIIDNCDYKIIQMYDFNDLYCFDFNTKLDLLYIKKEVNHNSYSYFNNQYLSLNLSSFPNYDNNKISLSLESNACNKIQFINDNSFFTLKYKDIRLYKIKDNKFSFVNKIQPELDIYNCKITDFNSEYYCLTDLKIILLLNKSNFVIAKTINIDPYLGLLKISDKIVSIYLYKNNNLYSQNYNILFGGIKWDLNNTKQIINVNYTKFSQSNNYIMFSRDYFDSSLFEIKPVMTEEVIKAEEATKITNKNLFQYAILILSIIIFLIIKYLK